MDKYFLAFVLGFIISLGANSQVYVSPNGDDTQGDGSIQNPFRTIGKAISVISKSGDPCTTTVNIYTNRVLQVEGNMTLEPVCFNSCSSCE